MGTLDFGRSINHKDIATLKTKLVWFLSIIIIYKMWYYLVSRLCTVGNGNEICFDFVRRIFYLTIVRIVEANSYCVKINFIFVKNFAHRIEI